MSAKGGFTVGPSHDDGGIPMTVRSTGQKIEVEGGEGIINKHSMADNREFSVKGTPRQIASAINEIDGNGISFDKGANIQKLAKGGELFDLKVSDRYAKNRNKFEMHTYNNGKVNKIGEAKLGSQYKYPHLVEVKNIKIDEDFRHPHTYHYFAKEIAKKSEKQGIVINIDCINDECFVDFIDIANQCKDGKNLVIK